MIAVLLLLAAITVPAASVHAPGHDRSLGALERALAANDTAPDWFRHELEALTRSGGRWITDNRAYMSENERFDQYGIEWTWGLGRKSVKGRLYALIAGKEAGNFWEFRIFWHPAESRAVVQQFASDGTVGLGTMTSDGKGGTRMDQMFHSPTGGSRRSGHESHFEGNVHVTQSLAWRDGAWQKDRIYRWVLTPAS